MHFIFSCFFFPVPLLLAQIQGSQQVPEAWVLARRQSLLQTFLASLETRVDPTLLASTHSTCSIPQSRAPVLLDRGFQESPPLQDQGWDRPSGTPPASRDKFNHAAAA